MTGVSNHLCMTVAGVFTVVDTSAAVFFIAVGGTIVPSADASAVVVMYFISAILSEFV